MTKRNDADESNDYWFPAKRYGWGWGLPSNGKGWLVFCCFLLACCLAPVVSSGSLLWTLGIIFAAAGCLTAIAYFKGEPPTWRWGNE